MQDRIIKGRKRMAGADWQVQYAAVLDNAAVRVQQFCPDSARMVKSRLPRHSFKPAARPNLGIVIEEEQDIALCKPRALVAHTREIEFLFLTLVDRLYLFAKCSIFGGIFGIAAVIDNDHLIIFIFGFRNDAVHTALKDLEIVL